MAKSSINIQASKDGSAGHNSREHFSHSVVFTDEQNECSSNLKDAYALLRSELKKRSEKYTERTGQKLQKNTVTQLSAVVNLEQHHTLKDLEPLKAELEAKFGTKVVQMAIHRDEGKLISKADNTELYSGKDFFLNRDDNKLYFDKAYTKLIPMDEYEIKKNYHAHIEMLGLDENGQAIRQKMNRIALQQLQTFTAQSLGMERGQESKRYTKEQMQEITALVGKKSDYASTTLYAQKFNEVARDLGYFIQRTKRQDTHPFKEMGSERETNKRAVLAKSEDLKAEIAQLRAELKEAKAVRADYARLDQFSKELKAQLEAKDLTIETLRSSVDYWRDGYKRESKETENLKKQLSEALQSKNTPETIKDMPQEEKSDFRASEGHYLRETMKLRKENKELKEEHSKLKMAYESLKQHIQEITGYAKITEAIEAIKAKFSHTQEPKREEKPNTFQAIRAEADTHLKEQTAPKRSLLEKVEAMKKQGEKNMEALKEQEPEKKKSHGHYRQ